MSGHVNGSNATGGSSTQSGYPVSPWAFAPASFNATSIGGNHAPTTTSAAVGNSSASNKSRSARGGGSTGFAPRGRGRYGGRTGTPYEASLAIRRMNTATASSARDRRTQGNGQGQGDPERKRVVVACVRCRKRKIRCSGDDGAGGACSNCKNANEPHCLFMRVNAGSLAEMRQKAAGQIRSAPNASANTFDYDLGASRQYHRRGEASVGLGTMPATTAASSTAYVASYGGAAAFAAPGTMYPTSTGMYNWVPGSATGGGYGGDNGQGSNGTESGAANMAYGFPYHGLPYHGIPSPDASYMGENDLMERSSTAADGAFALQHMSQGLPPTSSGGSGNASPYGGLGPMATMTTTATPRSLPGPPTVLGSSRGVPPSSVFSGVRPLASGGPQQYPSPATTPIASGVSPVWTGYEQSPYATAAMPAAMAAQSLDRLPDLYSATPPPPPISAGESAVAAASSSCNSQTAGEEQGLGGGDSGSSHQSGHHQQHFGYDYGGSRTGTDGQDDSNSGVGMAASGGY